MHKIAKTLIYGELTRTQTADLLITKHLLCGGRIKSHQYQTDMDTVGNYAAENLVLQPESKLQSSKLFTHYKEWCRVMGYTSQDDRGFKSSLLQIDGVSHSRRRNGRFYDGLSYQPHGS